MTAYWTDLYSFVAGAIREKDLAYLVMCFDSASEKKIPLASVVQWEPDGWGDGGHVRWRATGAAITKHPREQLIVVGELGDALVLGGGDRHEETVESGDSKPADRGPLRGVRRIGENIYVVGMDRQVYRRDAVDSWSSFDKGIPRDYDPKSISGFEAVDGFSENDIYAVGWDGDIWNCVDGGWHQETSPVGQVLLDVCCGGDGLVYACARNGVLIRGKRGEWETLDFGEFSESLWSVAWFQGRLYAASTDSVFVLGDDDLLAPVYMGEDHAKTCYRLVTGAGIMWSIGAKDVMSFDGQKWIRID
jgi:hypothetical protein